MLSMVKAKIIDKGELVVVITELGQKAVVPKDKLCELIQRFNLELVDYSIECRIRRVGGDLVEFE